MLHFDVLEHEYKEQAHWKESIVILISIVLGSYVTR